MSNYVQFLQFSWNNLSLRWDGIVEEITDPSSPLSRKFQSSLSWYVRSDPRISYGSCEIFNFCSFFFDRVKWAGSRLMRRSTKNQILKLMQATNNSDKMRGISMRNEHQLKNERWCSAAAEYSDITNEQ